jgi:hypothetical protein
MSKLEVNAVEPQCGTNLTLGASGDTIIIPSGATISNQGTAAGFGPTGAVSWNTTKITADPNPAVTGVGYFADTTSAAFTITLPATPAAGAVVGIADYANTFATNNLTVGRNSSNIGGVANNAILSTNGLSVTFVYVDATQGWIVTDSGNRSDLPVPQFIAATGGCISTSGDYKIHTFTGPGTFTVSSAGNPLGSSTVDYLVVAGGGGSGLAGGGGGGAGGYRESSGTASGSYSVSPLGSGVPALPVSVQGYPITVGSGGAGLTVPSPIPGPPYASRGSNSIFSTITSTGGGGSSSQTEVATPQSPGGSGGGLGKSSPGSAVAGNTPPVSPSQGSPGGISGTATAGGGGGATSAGSTGKPAGPAAGGAGATSSINGTPTTRAGGGGGGSDNVCQPGGAAGPGGGGIGGNRPDGGTSTNGTANTGGGAGGTGESAGSGTQRNGGSGIVIIRYKFQ